MNGFKQNQPFSSRISFGSTTGSPAEKQSAARENVREQHYKNMNTPQKTGKPFPIVPTTKILAVGRFTSPPTPEQIKEYFPREVPATLKLYLEGKIDQWWARQDQTGPVFLLNVTSIKEAHELLEALPLGQGKLMEFEYSELTPLTPLHSLLAESSK